MERKFIFVDLGIFLASSIIQYLVHPDIAIISPVTGIISVGLGKIVVLLKIKLNEADGLTQGEIEWSNRLKNARKDEKKRKYIDEHRKNNIAWIESLVDEGFLTPQEAKKARERWDKTHGYH